VSDGILLIGGRLQAVQKAKALGLHVVLLQHKDRLLPGQAEAADALLLVDYLDWDTVWPIVRAAHQAYGFTAVVSLVEQAMELVGRFNDLLGLPGTSYEVAHRFHDKLAMRRWLQAGNFETVAAEEVHDVASLRSFGDRHGYPVVLKPADGTGSRGVLRIDGPDQAAAGWQQAAGLRTRPDLPMAKFYPVDQLIVEEYLTGPEYSAETFSFAGRHTVIAFTEKLSDGVLEMGHAQPAPLGDRLELELTDYLQRYLTAMGLRDGVAHTEFKLTPAGPRIIEGHDRVAGDRVMDLVSAVYGIDLEQYAVGWPHRRVAELSERPAPRCAAATRFLVAEPGIVRAVEGAAEVRAYPGVLDLDLALRPGDTVAPLLDNFDRVGQLLVTSDTVLAAVELCDSLLGKIRIHTTSEQERGAP
jgi:biotin carboxylase